MATNGDRKRSSDSLSPIGVQSKASSSSPPMAKQMKFHSPPFSSANHSSRPHDLNMSAPNVTVTPQNTLFAEQNQLRGLAAGGFNQIPFMMQRTLNQMSMSTMSPNDITSLLTSAAVANRNPNLDHSTIASHLQNYLPRTSAATQHHPGLPLHPQLNPGNPFGAQNSPNAALNPMFDAQNSLLVRSAMLQQLYQRVASNGSLSDPSRNVPTSNSQHSPNSAPQISPNFFQNPFSNSSPSSLLGNKLAEFSPTGKNPSSLMDQDFLFKNLTKTASADNDLVAKLKDFRS